MRKAILLFIVITLVMDPINIRAKEDYFSQNCKIPTDYQKIFNEIGEMKHICPEVMEAIAYHESRFMKDVKNGNCYGLMQVNVNVHSDRIQKLGYTPEDMLEAYPNIDVASDLLVELYEKHGDDNAIVLMYYAGDAKAIKRYKKNGQTTKYVEEILSRSEEYERKHGK